MSRRHLSILVPYYNFSSSRAREVALGETLQALPVDAEVILVAMGKRPDVCPRVKLLEITEAAVLWQRERFWNIALEHIGSGDGTVVWIDSDIVFSDETWVDQLEEELARSELVHLFGSVADIQHCDNRALATGRIRQSVVKVSQLSGTVAWDDYFSRSGVSLSLGCSPGFAWASRADLIKEVQFPDFLILGSGDKAFLAAAMGYQKEYAAALNLNQSLRKLYLAWAGTVYARVQGRVGYIENSIQHVAQGVYERRRYSDRYSIIGSSKFSIHDVLKIGAQGAWLWRDEHSPYAHGIQAYFEGRDD